MPKLNGKADAELYYTGVHVLALPACARFNRPRTNPLSI